MFLVKWNFRYQNKQYYELYSCPTWWMLHENLPYYRKQRVAQEMRRWYRDKDEELLNIKRRRRSPRYLNTWGLLEKYSNTKNAKGWKTLYKVKHQWEKPKYYHENILK